MWLALSGRSPWVEAALIVAGVTLLIAGVIFLAARRVRQRPGKDGWGLGVIRGSLTLGAILTLGLGGACAYQFVEGIWIGPDIPAIILFGGVLASFGVALVVAVARMFRPRA